MDKESALQKLQDDIDYTCDLAAENLSSKDIATLLRELASDWDSH